MKVRSLVLMSGIAATVLLSLAWTARPTVSSPTPAPLAGPIHTESPPLYKIDPVHSNTFFRIKHLGVSNFYGRFKTTEGEYRFDPTRPNEIEFSVTIPAASVDSNNPGRDKHIKSPDFFDVKEFENISFQSTSVKKKSGDVFTVTGNLTLHGVTKTITAEVEWIGESDRGGRRFGHRSGFEARFTVKRSDYGMSLYAKEGMLGDAVTIIAAIEGQRKESSPQP